MSRGWFIYQGQRLPVGKPRTLFDTLYPIRSGEYRWIYAIQEHGAPLVKIGNSFHLRKRLHIISATVCASATLIGAVAIRYPYPYRVEYRIHHMLHAQRIHGEWFYLYMNQTFLEDLVAQALEAMQ